MISWKKALMKYFIAFLSVVVLVLGVPIVINEAYKMNSGYATVWTASDVLAYYSVILSGIISVVALVITIYYNQKNVEKQLQSHKAQTKIPFFCVEKVMRCDGTTFHQEDNKIWSHTFAFDLNGVINSSALIEISLLNIGDGKTFEPSCYSMSNVSFDFASVPHDRLIIKYDFQKTFAKHWDECKNSNKMYYRDTIVLEFENLYGIKFRQLLKIEFRVELQMNQVILKVSDTSYINVLHLTSNDRR